MPNTESMIQFKYGLQTNFDLIEEKDVNTVYFVTDTQRLFVGDVEYTRPVQHGAAVPAEYLPPNSFFVKETGTARELYYSKDGASWDKISILPPVVSGGVFGDNTGSLNPAFGGTFKIPKVTVDNNGFVTAVEDQTVTLPTETAETPNTVSVVGEGNAVTSADFGDGHTLTLTKGVTMATKAEHDALAGQVAEKAPINNPTFTGKVTLPGNPVSDNDAANKKYVDDQDQAMLEQAKEYANGILGANDAMVFKGTVGGAESGATVTDFASVTDYKVGWTYRVITAGTYADVKCEIGDLIIAVSDYSESFKPTDWTIAQTNIDGAVTSDAGNTADNIIVGAGGQKVKDSGTKLSDMATNASVDSKLANKVDTATTVAITGGAVAEATPLTNGSVELNVTEVKGANVTGAVPEATKVTNKLTVGSKQFDGSAPVTITKEDLGVTDKDTTYTFQNGEDGSFTVTPLAGEPQKVSIGKPATAGTADNATHATAADTATTATSAESATKATQDGDGNVITTTYATKEEVTAVALKWGTF